MKRFFKGVPKKARKSIFIKWILSYLLILMIPLLLGAVVYFHANKTAREQSGKINQSLVKAVRMELDYHIGIINRNLEQIALNNQTQLASNVTGSFEGKNAYLPYSLYKDLNKMKFSDGFIEDIFVYFNNTQSVSSTLGNMSGERFYDLYYKNEGYDFNAFRDYMDQDHKKDILSLSLENEKNILLFTMTSLNSDIGSNSTTIGITVNLENVEKMIGGTKWEEDIFIYILNSENEFINRAESSYVEFDYASVSSENSSSAVISGENYVIAASAFQNVDWKLISASPIALIEKSAKQIQTIAVIGLFICILVGSISALYLAKSNYNPLKGLMDLFSKRSGPEWARGENEYQWLQEQASLLFQEHFDAKVILRDNKKLLKDYAFFRLLEYADGWRKIESTHMPGNDHYIVILFSIKPIDEDRKEEFEANYMQNIGLYQFIIENIYSERVLNYFKVELGGLGEQVAAVVSMPSDDYDYLELLKETIYELQQIVQEKFNFCIEASIGSLKDNLEGVHISYIEAKEAAVYSELLETDLVFYEDIKNTHKQYYYPIELEQKIINAIKITNPDQAFSYISQVLDINYKEYKASMWVRQCIFFDLLSTIVKESQICGFAEVADEVSHSNKLSRRLALSEVKDYFEKLLTHVCMKISKLGEENEGSQHLGEEIKKFIMEQYHDPDLNISQTGFHFDLTPAYISRVFKHQTGESLLEYINAVRIEKAMELLKEGQSVTEIAGKIGFRNSGALIRVFKRKTGITPGQMQKKI